MKAYACIVGLCLLAGIVSADYAWETGKSYTYKVHSRALAGIAEINNKYTGLEFSYNQILTPMGGNLVNVQIKNLQVIEVNEQLEQGWRQSPIDQPREAKIPSELERYLTSPMNMKVVKGVVESIQVEGNLPTWAINIKRAQASAFTADTTGKNVVVEGNLNRQTNSVRPEMANQESGFFFEVVEETVHGECEVYYTVSQNGPFDYPYQFQKQSQAGQRSGQSGEQSREYSQESQESLSQSQSQENQGLRGIRQKQFRNKQGGQSSSSSSSSSEERSAEQAWPKAFYNLCQKNDQVYEIIKTVNFTTCSQKPVLGYSSPAELNFRPADNAGGSLWTRALITRMLACGESRQNYTILKITQQEQIQTGLLDQEKVVAGTQKNITLISIRQGHPSPVHSPKTINSLVYQFDPQEQRQQLQSGQQKRFSSEEQTRQGSQEQYGSSSQESSTWSSKKQGSSEEYQRDGYLSGGKQSQYQKGRRSGSKSGSQSSSESQEQGQQRFSSSQEQQQGQQRFGSSEEQQQGQQQQGQLPKPSMDRAPLASMLITPLNRQQLKERVHELMQEIVQDLTTPTQSQGDSIAKRETLSKINTVVKTIRLLDFQDIQQVSHKWIQGGEQRQQVGKQIFVEAVSMAGTNPAVKFLIQLIKSGQLHGEEAAHPISMLPMYVRTPTKELLRTVFELVDNQAVKRNEQTHTSAILAFTTLAHQACVNKKIKNSRYPVALYGEFCSPQLVQQQYAPFFIQKLEKLLQQNQNQDKHMIFVCLKGLANLGVPEIIPVVQKIMDLQSETIIKVKAIYSLQNLIQSRGNLNQQQQQGQQQEKIISADRQSFDVVTDKLVEKHVLPLLASVAFDSGEHPSVRAAAISLLVHCTYTDTALWQQLAMSTWFERSRSIHSFIHSLIYSLAQLHTPIAGRQWVQQQKARQVINLLKPIDASLSRSHKLFTAQFIEDVNTGFSQQLQWIESKDSIIPNYVYYHSFFNFGNNGAKTSPLEVSLAGNTISKLVFAVYDAIVSGTKQQQQQGKEQGNVELKTIRSLLNIETREQQEPIVGNLFINVRNEMQRMWTVDEATLQQLTQKLITKVLSTGKMQMPVNYQKVAQLAEHVASFPTALGFPLVYRMRMSSLLSVRGQVQLTNPQGAEYQVQADLAPVVAWKVHRQLAFKCPLTGKKYQSGIQRHFVAELPFSAVGRRAPRGQIQIAITPRHLHQQSPKGTIDLITYHQIPYTAIIHDEFYPAVHPKGGQIQIVRVGQQEQEQQQQQEQFSKTRSFGQNALGLQFQVQERSDYAEEQETVSGWAHFFRQFHTTNCAFNAAWLGSPSIRFAQRTLVLNLDQSQTKTLVLVAGAKLQRVSVVDQLQSSEEVNSQERKSGSKSGSSSSSSSSSSESQEGQQFFNIVRSPKNYRKEQRRYSKQQSQSQSRSQSQSKSNSQSGSQENQGQGQTGQKVSQGPQRNVIVIALLGKKVPLQLLSVRDNSQQQQSSSEEQNQSGQQSRQQYGQQSRQQYGRQSRQYGQSSSQEQNQSGQNSQSSSQEQRRQRYQKQSSSEEQGQQQTTSQEQINQQGPLQKGSPSTVQYLLHVAQSAQGKLFVRMSLGDAANQAAESLPQSQSLQGVRDAVAGSRNGQSQLAGCIEFQGTIDTPKGASRHVIAYTRKSLLEQNLSVKVQAHLQAGKNCRFMPLYVKVQGKLLRDQEMTEWAKTQSPKAQRCTADEKKGFSVSQVCMEVAREQAAALNEMQLKIEHSQMPVVVKNVTAKLETLLKAVGYMYLSENQQPESTPAQQHQINLWARMTPCKRFISFHVNQPNSILKFENMRTNQVVRALLPLTATNTIVGNVQRRLLRSQFHPTCQLEGKYVNTFDNVTYSFNPKVVQNCQTLLVKDCSGRYPMAVFAQDIQKKQDQYVTILLGQEKKIELIPANTYKGKTNEGNSQIVVLINGKQTSLPHIIRNEQSSSKQPIAEIMKMPNGGVQVLGRHIQVASDGQRILLKIHELLRNRTCGICGDFDNEKVADMRSPKDVPLSSGSLLVASYSFKAQTSGQTKGGSNQQCTVNQHYKKQVQQEEQRFQSRSGNQYSSSNQRRGQQYVYGQQQRAAGQSQYYSNNLQQSVFAKSSSSSSSESSERQQQSGEQRGQFVYVQRAVRNPQDNNQMCFTLNKLPKCASSYQPRETIQKQVKAYCMPNGPKAEQIQQQIQGGQYKDLSTRQQGQQVQTIRVAVPKHCAQE